MRLTNQKPEVNTAVFTKKSLYWNYIRAIVIILLIAFTLFGGIIITQTAGVIQNSTEKKLIDSSHTAKNILLEQIEDINWMIDYFGIYTFIHMNDKVNTVSDMLNGSGMDFIVADSDGNMIYSSISEYTDNDFLMGKVRLNKSTQNELKYKREFLKEASLSDVADIIAQSDIDDVKKYVNTKKRMMIMPLGMKTYFGSVEINKYEVKQLYGYVIVLEDIGDISQAKMSIVKIMLFASGVVLLIIFMIVGFWTYRMLKPLHQMALATKSFAQGDFSKRVDVDSEDEIGQLSLSFNQMADSLATSEGIRRNFVANVSHELKTPMTTIAGFINGILDGTIPKEKEANYLKIVSNEIRRLSRLVESMLSLSRIDSGELKLRQESFNISSTIFNTILTFENNIESKKIDVRGLEDIPDITVVGDPDMIHQVIYNLIENAVKFVNEGGYIEVKTLDTYEKCVIKITNSGTGIAENELKHIFEKFYKTDKSRSIDKKGMGLGLYIVKTIIRLHGGDIYAKSVMNEYTTFEFYIPKKVDKSKHYLKASGKNENTEE